ncbi:hypothetical protein FOZ60_004146 [Perkinsus olseni]|uniref:Amidase domain-containing protein n=1 Tax=Perkinsus olseni TaxID=32597 RepID=A0A7J6NTZ2_PEROL|nr:hypothetical protein FOZ60_004146 [Perkinsus olseni]
MPTNVIKRVLRAISEMNPTLKTIECMLPHNEIIIMAQASSKRFAESKPRSMLDGVPFVVKGDLRVKGLPNLHGTNPKNPLPGTIGSDVNDPVVQALLDAGAILLGTATMHEYGTSPLGYNKWYEGPVNAFDVSRYSGGSSSGSATIVASGIVPFAIGLDGGGSIRIPSSWSGVVGLAPTFGRVNIETTGTPVSTVTHCGPIAATVADAAHVLRVIGKTEHQGTHVYDCLYGSRGRPPVHLHALAAPPRKNRIIKVGVFQDWVQHSDPEIYTAYKETLEKLNWEVHHFTLPNMNAQAVSHSLAITCEFSKTINHEDIGRLQPGTQIQLGFGRDISAVEALAIQRLKGWSLEQWNSVFENVDAVCTPTLPLTSIPIPKNAKSHGVFYPQLGFRMMRYVWPTNLLGFPSISVPVGYDAHGMPIGFQIICPHWKDDECLYLAMEVEKATIENRRKPIRYWRDLLG